MCCSNGTWRYIRAGVSLMLCVIVVHGDIVKHDVIVVSIITVACGVNGA